MRPAHPLSSSLPLHGSDPSNPPPPWGPVIHGGTDLCWEPDFIEHLLHPSTGGAAVHQTGQVLALPG